MMQIRAKVDANPQWSLRNDTRQVAAWLDFVAAHDAEPSWEARVLVGARFFYLDYLLQHAQEEVVRAWLADGTRLPASAETVASLMRTVQPPSEDDIDEPFGVLAAARKIRLAYTGAPLHLEPILDVQLRCLVGC